VEILQDNSSFPSELGVLCALAGVNFPRSSIPDHRKVCASCANFEL
jgi:hypothetical protein